MKRIAGFVFLLILLLIPSSIPLAEEAPSANSSFLEISLELNPDSYPRKFGVMYPQYAIWVEDAQSGQVQTIYVTQKAAKDKWIFASERPMAVPVWYGVKKKEQKAGGLKDIDAITAATPEATQEIRWPIPASFAGKELTIYLEANCSFHYNDYYKKGAKKGEPGYSHYNGQPSLVWKAVLQKGADAEKDVSPSIIGHGHVMGTDHAINPDLTGFTTAKEIFKSIRYRYVAAEIAQ